MAFVIQCYQMQGSTHWQFNCSLQPPVHATRSYTRALDDMRDLGIIIDSKLKFHAHSDSVTNKANGTLGLIYKVFECKDADIILNLYKSLVRPQLEYNNAIWGPHYISDKQKVEVIQ